MLKDFIYGVDYTQKPLGQADHRFKHAVPYRCLNKQRNYEYTNVIWCDNVIIADKLLQQYQEWGETYGATYEFIDSDIIKKEQEKFLRTMWTDHYIDTTSEVQEAV